MNPAILQTLPQIQYAAGHTVIAEGTPLQGLYFLESGEVEVLKSGILITEIYEAGAVFGEMSFLLNTPPTATVRTISPSSFRHAVDPAAFFLQYPEASLHVARILARRLDSLNRYLVDIKHQFKDRGDHLGIIDEVLDSLMLKHPRDIPRRSAGH